MTQREPVKARDVLLSHWDHRVPVDLFALARALGIEVSCGPGSEDEETDLCAVVSCGAGRPRVRVSPSAAEPRRRFALAHAIGHVYLRHEGEFLDRISTYSTTQHDLAEAACNRFAVELLMPESAVKHFIMKLKVQDLRALARRFGVSEVAMRYQLQRLGWISR